MVRGSPLGVEEDDGSLSAGATVGHDPPTHPGIESSVSAFAMLGRSIVVGSEEDEVTMSSFCRVVVSTALMVVKSNAAVVVISAERDTVVDVAVVVESIECVIPEEVTSSDIWEAVDDVSIDTEGSAVVPSDDNISTVVVGSDVVVVISVSDNADEVGVASWEEFVGKVELIDSVIPEEGTSFDGDWVDVKVELKRTPPPHAQHAITVEEDIAWEDNEVNTNDAFLEMRNTK
jgi:hypothetical protein